MDYFGYVAAEVAGRRAGAGLPNQWSKFDYDERYECSYLGSFLERKYGRKRGLTDAQICDGLQHVESIREGPDSPDCSPVREIQFPIIVKLRRRKQLVPKRGPTTEVIDLTNE